MPINCLGLINTNKLLLIQAVREIGALIWNTVFPH